MTKTVKVFFTLSILLNLMLGGAVAGHMYRNYQDIDDFADTQIQTDISPETRQIMRQVYKDKHREIWNMRADMRQKKIALKRVILTEPFDKKAFEKAANDVKKQNARAYDSRVDTFSKVLDKLPSRSDQKLAQRTVDILVGQRKWDTSKGKNPFASEDEKEGEKDGKESDKKESDKKKVDKK